MPTYLSPGVYVEEVEAGSRPIEGVGTAVAAFVGFAARGPLNQPTLITNWSQFTQTFGEFLPGSYLGHAVYGYLNNGGGAAYVVRIGQSNGAEPPRAELTAAAQPSIGAYQVVALEEAEGTEDGAPLEVSVTPSPSGNDALKLSVSRGGKVIEEFDELTTDKGDKNIEKVVNATSTQIRLEPLEMPSGIEPRPATGTVALAVPPAPTPTEISPDDYVGGSADRTGFGGLEEVDEVTMVSVPDAMAAFQAGILDAEGLQAVQLGLIAHCESMGDRMAIVDPPPGLKPQQINEWRMQKSQFDSKFAALYWPWIKVFDPPTGKNVFVPPSGHMAGVWARSDATRGVHKAPANEVVRGVVALETQITKGEHDLLNPNGINCIRAFAGRGIRVWGARTVSSDPSWRYINVRRLFNYVEESILEGTQWVVFEPNDMDLWARIRRTISGFLLNVWRDGALFGATPDEAFYVKCDAETNPPEAVEAGIVACEIGIAPVKPAEFVVFRISQYSGGAEISE
jgi:Bacteriophage tail sheath protein